MDAEEERARDLMHASHSGTSVYEECLERKADCVVWMEPGSVLVLEGDALFDFVHGLPAQEDDLYDGSATNARLVSRAAVRARAAAHGKEPTHAAPDLPVTVPRHSRVSVVLWTAFTPPDAHWE